MPEPADVQPVGRYINGKWTDTAWYVRGTTTNGFRADIRRFNNERAARAYADFYNRLLPTEP